MTKVFYLILILISVPVGLSAQRLFEARTDYPTPIFSTHSAATGDFDNDGNVDILVGNVWDGRLVVFMGRGGSQFELTDSLSVGQDPWDIEVYDFNGDGNLDFVTTKTFGSSVRIWIGNGNGNFSFGGEFETGTSPIAITLGDFNNDGKMDISTGNSSSQDISTLLGNGNGTFKASITT